MGNRLFVGNLSFSTSQVSLEATFGAVGEVREVSMPMDRTTGQPRGFAFVTMNNAQAAANAISQLNGATIDGREIRVDEATERPRNSGFGGGGGGARGRSGGEGSQRRSRDRF